MSNFYTEPFVSAGEMEFPSEPYITAQPQNHTATGPEEYVLTVIAAGAVSYQWEVFDGESWSTIPGATSDTLTISIDSSMNGWRYRVLVTGADGSTVTSKAAQIAVKGVHEITLEGAIVTFTGPARIKSLEVEINAVQDLHGQANPYPAGGGKNILNPNLIVAEGRYELNADQSIKVLGSDGRAWASVDAIPLKAGTYYIRFFGQTTYAQIRTSDDDYATTVISTQMENEGTFTLAEDGGIKIKFALSSTYPQTIKPIISTSSITAWSPYENICPISGWNSVDLVVSPTLDAEDGTTYPISLGQTVYGGVLDVTSGVLTITHGIVDLGTLTWVKHSSEADTFYVNLAGAVPAEATSLVADALCSQYAVVSRGYQTDKTLSINKAGANARIFIVDSTYGESTASEFKTAMDGVQLVYELATPTTITLTPTEVTTLLGDNNIWADCGDVRVTIVR